MSYDQMTEIKAMLTYLPNINRKMDFLECNVLIKLLKRGKIFRAMYD